MNIFTSISTAKEIKEFIENKGEEITIYEVLDLLVKIEQNKILENAFVIASGVPSAPEKIAMELEGLKKKMDAISLYCEERLS